MATNYGLLTNMAEGIKEGLAAYQVVRNQDRQDKLLEMQLRNQAFDQKFKMKESGLLQDESGNLSYEQDVDKAKRLARQLAVTKAEREQGLYKPGSAADSFSGTVYQRVTGEAPKPSWAEADIEDKGMSLLASDKEAQAKLEELKADHEKQRENQALVHGMSSGMFKNPQTGQWEYTPEMKSKMEAERSSKLSEIDRKKALEKETIRHNKEDEKIRAEANRIAEIRARQPKQAQPKKYPLEVQTEIQDLTRKKVNRVVVANDMEAALKQLEDPNMSDDEKLIVGRELAKTLNSVQGADAVGSEESRRLLSLLEYKILPRIGEPGKTFGRDIPLFTTQVRNNMDRVRQSAKAAQDRLDFLTGKSPSGLISQPGAAPQGAATQGLVQQGSPVGTVKAGRGGVSYKKTKAGPDNDKNNWAPVKK